MLFNRAEQLPRFENFLGAVLTVRFTDLNYLAVGPHACEIEEWVRGAGLQNPPAQGQRWPIPMESIPVDFSSDLSPKGNSPERADGEWVPGLVQESGWELGVDLA